MSLIATARFRLLSSKHGKVVWRKKTDIAISAGTGVGEGLVLVGSSEGELVAFDAETGEIRWRTEVSSEVLSVPQVYDDVVIVQTVDGNLAGLDADSGEALWIHDRSVPVLTLRGTSTPLVADGVVLAGFANGKMTALETDSGREIWEAAVAVPRGRTELQRIVDLDANPVVSSGRALCHQLSGTAGSHQPAGRARSLESRYVFLCRARCR